MLRDFHVISVKQLTCIFQRPKIYHSIKVQDKCKNGSSWDAEQVERTEIYSCANLLLAAARKHAYNKVNASITYLEENASIIHTRIMNYFYSDIYSNINIVNLPERVQ